MPVAAFDIDAQGKARPIAPDDPQDGTRWVHWDRNDPELAPWARQHMPEQALEALLETETRPRLLSFDGGMLLILRGVNLNPGQMADDMVSLRMWLCGDLLVTCRIRKVFAIDAIRAEAAKGTLPATAPALMARIVYELSQRIERETEDLEDRVDDIEELMFEDPTHADLEALPRLRRAVIRLRRFVVPQAAALGAAAAFPGLTESVRHSLRDSADEAARAVELLDAARDRLASAAEHVELNRASELGRNSSVLSVVAAIFLPLGFLTGLFGVNVAGMPGTGEPMAFWMLTAGMVAVGVVVALLLRWLRLY